MEAQDVQAIDLSIASCERFLLSLESDREQEQRARTDAEDIAHWALAELGEGVILAQQDWDLQEAAERLHELRQRDPSNQVVRVAWFLLQQLIRALIAYSRAVLESLGEGEHGRESTNDERHN